MIEDLALIRNYSILKQRKNIICGSRDYVRKAGKLLVRAGMSIEQIYCDDVLSDSELQNIKKSVFFDIFERNDLDQYNLIYAESDQEQMDQHVKQLATGREAHIYTYCGLYYALSFHANRNEQAMKNMICMNNLNIAMGSFDFAAKWLRGIRWVEESGISLILYAMPKTGTQAMKATLNQYGFEHTYVHFLNMNALISKQLYTYYNEKIACLSEMLDYPAFVTENYLNSIKKKKIKIITSIREPIARNFSLIFQSIKNWSPYALARKSNGDFEQGIIKCLDHGSNSSWDWFDDEIKEIFGIDVFKYPFDKNQGYCVIKKDNVEIFLYRLESSKQLDQALGAFLGAKDIRMLTYHEAQKEEYRFIYEQLKRELHLPENIISQYYDNDKMRHFYTEDEIRNLQNVWG